MHDIVIKGELVTLKPYSESEREKIIALRNTERGQYFLNQGFKSTIETQIEWEKAYLKRKNDYYWVIECTSTKHFIGSTALYDLEGGVIEKGRLVVDEKMALKKPYVLEAELLLIYYAFEVLKVNKIITRTKLDNEKMKSINKRLGFVKNGDCIIKGEEYEIFELDREKQVDYSKYKSLIKRWSTRA